jgi:hypothetical protein
LRAAIKSFPLANLIDSLYIFKHPKYNFKFTDFRFGFLVLKEENKRSLSLKLISTSSIIYYLPLITITFRLFLPRFHLLETHQVLEEQYYILLLLI